MSGARSELEYARKNLHENMTCVTRRLAELVDTVQQFKPMAGSACDGEQQRRRRNFVINEAEPIIVDDLQPRSTKVIAGVGAALWCEDVLDLLKRMSRETESQSRCADALKQ